MSKTATKNPPRKTQKVMHSITPHLICANALEAIEFYKQAFGAEEGLKLLTPDGNGLVHASLTIGDSTIMLAAENAEYGSFGPITLKGSPVVIHLHVPNADAAIDKAIAAGATLTMPATDMFWGDRYGQVTDPYGHLWSIASTIREMTADEIQEALATAPPC